MDSFSDEKDALLPELEAQVERALQLLDDDAATEYRTAVQRVPELVKSETPPSRFLRTEDFHVVRAAKRMALYWKSRKEFFGRRWLLPMDQTGAGALTANQVQLLRTGFLALVEKPDPVMITDITRLPIENGIMKFEPAIIPGIIFYLHHVFCQTAHVEGYILFHVIKNASSPPIASLINQGVGRKVVNSCAIKIKKRGDCPGI